MRNKNKIDLNFFFAGIIFKAQFFMGPRATVLRYADNPRRHKSIDLDPSFRTTVVIRGILRTSGKDLNNNEIIKKRHGEQT